MSEYVTLLGAEDVRHAGNAMRSAADDMRNAASTIDTALFQQRQFMDDWLQRFEAAIEKLSAIIPTQDPS